MIKTVQTKICDCCGADMTEVNKGIYAIRNEQLMFLPFSAPVHGLRKKNRIFFTANTEKGEELMAKNITIITCEGCYPCRSLKYELSKRDVEFTEIDELEIDDESVEVDGVPTTILEEKNNQHNYREVIYGYSQRILDKIVDFWRKG